MTKDSAVIIENLSYTYPHAKRQALRNINLQISKGEFVAILGANGAGKTTLLLTLNGIIPNSKGGRMKGRVIVDGHDTSQASVATLAQKVGMILEDPETQLFTTKIISEVAFGPENLSMPVPEIMERVKWALKVVRLEGYEERMPTALSGGQKQRLAIATALAMRPGILVLDEPTSQLDPVGAVEVFQVVQELKEKYGITIVMATHQSEEVAVFADKVGVLFGGELVAFGKPEEIFSDQELLSRTWVHAPQVSQLANYLSLNNINLDQFPITEEQVIAGIPRYFERICNCGKEIEMGRTTDGKTDHRGYQS